MGLFFLSFCNSFTLLANKYLLTYLLIRMLNGYLGHTDREEGLIQVFQNPMEYKNDYHRLMLLSFASFVLLSAFILCLTAFSV